MAAHEQSVGKSDEWYTPPDVFDALGCRFDLDVSSPGRDATPWRSVLRLDQHSDKRRLPGSAFW
jgi:hypothetical protein